MLLLLLLLECFEAEPQECSQFFLFLCIFLFWKKESAQGNNNEQFNRGRERPRTCKNQKIKPDGKNEALLDNDANDSSRKVGGLSFFFFFEESQKLKHDGSALLAVLLFQTAGAQVARLTGLISSAAAIIAAVAFAAEVRRSTPTRRRAPGCSTAAKPTGVQPAAARRAR